MKNSIYRYRRHGFVDDASFGGGGRWPALAAVNVSVHGKIVVGFQAGQSRWTFASMHVKQSSYKRRKSDIMGDENKTYRERVDNSRVSHEVIDATRERYVDGPSARGVLVAVLGAARNAVSGRSDISLEKMKKLVTTGTEGVAD